MGRYWSALSAERRAPLSLTERLALGLAALSIAATFSTQGHAYCLTRTCDPKSDSCDFDEFGCNLSGSQLFWPSSCVSFDVQKDGSAKRQITYDTLHGVVVNAFQQWTQVDCGGGTHPSIQLLDRGPVSCAKPEYNQSQPNANIVTFHDGKWTHTNSMETIALTSIFFDRKSGEIYDANVEINSDQYDFADGNPTGAQIDLNAALVHEAGHFLGLSHSGVPTATMYWMYSTDAASLDDDDVMAICTTLPPDRMPLSSDCTPRHGFSGDCATAETGCCAMAIGSNRSPSGRLPLLLVALGSLVWRRRSSARRA